MKMTKAELDRLAELNREREPLNDKLQEEAERMFDDWNKKNPPKHGYRTFQSGDLTDYGCIRILFGTGCSCSGRGEDDYVELPIEAATDAS